MEPLDGVGGERVRHDGEKGARLVDGREPEQAAHRRAVGPPSQHDRRPEGDEERHVGHGQGDAAGLTRTTTSSTGIASRGITVGSASVRPSRSTTTATRSARYGCSGTNRATPNMRASRVTTDRVHSSGPWRRARRVMRRPPERFGMRVRPRPVRAGSDAAGPGRRRRDHPGGRTARPTRPADQPGPPATRRRRSACAGSAPAILEVSVAPCRVAARRPARVDRGHRGDHGVVPPQPRGTVGPVGLLRIEEEALVEPADLGQRLGPQQQHRPDREVRTVADDPAETDCLHPSARRRGERPAHPGRRARLVDLGGTTEASAGSASRARCRAVTSSAPSTASGLTSRTSAVGSSRSSRARLTPPPKPRLRPASR